MSRVRTVAPQSRRHAKKNDTSLLEALNEVSDPHLAKSLSVFFAELARAQLEGEQDMVLEARRAIAEAIRGVPEGEIDEPLLPLRKPSTRKRRK